MFTNIDELIKPVTAVNISTLSNDAATVTGSAITRTGFESATLLVLLGAASGTPTSGTVTITVQHSNDGSTYANTNYVFAISTSNTSPQTREYALDLRGLRKLIRVVATASFQGGTTPSVNIASVAVLGTAGDYPV